MHERQSKRNIANETEKRHARLSRARAHACLVCLSPTRLSPTRLSPTRLSPTALQRDTIEEWVDETAKEISHFKPKRVIEMGCGESGAVWS